MTAIDKAVVEQIHYPLGSLWHGVGFRRKTRTHRMKVEQVNAQMTISIAHQIDHLIPIVPAAEKAV